MGHIHSIYDTDPHFKIDPVTRVITNMSETKTCIVQGDHNSERFTFECPRFIDGHDMSTCNQVQVHYINMDQAPREEHYGLYEVEDLDLSPEDENVVIFSWLISENATRYVGPLSFVVNFVCKTGTTIDYAWNTAIHADINVVTGINSGEPIIVEYADIMEAWKRELAAQQIVSMTQTKVGELDGGENVWTATFGNGMTANFVVRNGHAGQTNPAGTNYGSVKSGGDVTIENGIISVNWPGDDSGIAYSKTVPRGTSGVAEIKMLGGMTYKDGDTLRSAPVSAVESVGKNLCPVASITTSEFQSGAIQIYGIKKHGQYTLSANITKYADDTATNTRITIGVNYTDGTKTELGCALDASSSESDGVARRKTVTINTDTAKTISHIVLYLLNYSVANNRNAKAENICFVYGTDTEYTPYVKRTLEIPEAAQAKNGINENIYDYTDLTEVKKYVRVGMKDAGTLKWTVWDSNGDGVANRAYSDRFAKPNGSVIASALPVGIRDVYIDAYGAICAYITDGGYTSETFKAAMSGVMLYYELAEPIITDISDILPADNFIEVEGGGTVTMVNEYGTDVPSVVDFSATADVRVIPQSLTASQKEQARANIGIHVVDSLPSDLSAYAIGDIILVTE